MSQPARQRRAILAIHGFSGHPEEMRFLGEAVASGLDAKVVFPTLPGHATVPTDLAKTTAKDWYHSVEQTYDELAETYDQVVVIGNSFGANLALKLATHRPVPAVVAVSIPYITQAQRWLIWSLLMINWPFKKMWQKPTKGPHATEKIPGYTQHCYEEIPLKAIREMLIFSDREMIPKRLREIKSSVLLVVPTGDPLLPPTAAEYYVRHLGTERKKYLPWNDQYHLVVQGGRKAELAEELARWIRDELD